MVIYTVLFVYLPSQTVVNGMAKFAMAHQDVISLKTINYFHGRLNNADVSISHLVKLIAKISTFAVFMPLHSYSCENTAYWCDRCLYSHISSVIIFSPHINTQNCYTQCTLTGCELNGNIAVTVL
jgi:hypothetical protein